MRRMPWIGLAMVAILLIFFAGTTRVRLGTVPTPRKGPAIVLAGPAVMRPLRSPSPRLSITATTFADAKNGWMVGSETQGKRTIGFVEATTDGGRTWQRVFQRTNWVFQSVAFQNARDGWALRSTTGTLYQTKNGGHTWRQSAHWKGTVGNLTLSPRGAPWLAVTAPSATTSTVVRLKHGLFSQVWNAPGHVLALSMRGSSVTAEVVPPSPDPLAFSLYSTPRTHLAWQRVGTIVQYSSALAGPSKSSPLSGNLVWTSDHTGMASVFAPATCANGCSIAQSLITHDGGVRWHTLSAINIACQFGPILASRGSSVAAEDIIQTSTCGWPASTLFVSRNHGLRFSKSAGWPETGANAIGFASPTTLWAATGSALMMSFDHGQVWTQVFPAPIPTGTLTYASRHVLYAAGDQTNPNAILKSTDQGRRWRIVTSLNGASASSLSFSSVRDGWAVAQPLPSSTTELLHTTDGGQHWTVALRPPPGTSYNPIVRFFSQKEGEILNLGGACSEFCRYYGAVTHDGGAHWTAKSARRVPSGMGDGSILAPEVALGAVGTMPGGPIRVYETRDGGQTWPLLFTVPAHWGNGLSFSFLTARVGYLSVTDQKLAPRRGLPTPLPTFTLWKTTDGGHQWTVRRLPRLTTVDFSSVSIYFGSARDGMLQCNHTWWRTTDGGRVWTEILS